MSKVDALLNVLRTVAPPERKVQHDLNTVAVLLLRDSAEGVARPLRDVAHRLGFPEEEEPMLYIAMLVQKAPEYADGMLWGNTYEWDEQLGMERPARPAPEDDFGDEVV